jgi:predicted ATP-dependent protease
MATNQIVFVMVMVKLKKLLPSLRSTIMVDKEDIERSHELSDEEMARLKDLSEIERADRKQLQQRYMAWSAIASMVVFTLLLFTPLVKESRVAALADLLGLFYIAQAGVVGAFMGMSAWMNKGGGGR